jgi:hypothetical protein
LQMQHPCWLLLNDCWFAVFDSCSRFLVRTFACVT